MPVGAHLGRYRLVERRAVGGMGEVWRAAIDGPRGFSQPVVLKRIRPDLLTDRTIVAQFAAEARVCARLDHPGIVKVFEFGEADGEPYLAMELVDGWTLGDVLDAHGRTGTPVPVGLVAHVGACVADALAHAHALVDDAGHPCGLVHRDVSPSNVMITRHGAVKVVDFGAHTIRDRRADERSAVGLLRGTLAYMSPEQADGRPVDARSDIFSLGVVLHEALTGQRLFRGEGELDTLRRVREAVVSPIARADAAPALAATIRRMLARDPADRFRSAGEVASELRVIARQHQMDDAAMRAALAPLGFGRAPSRAATQLLVPDDRRSRRAWWIALAITTAVAAPYLLSPRAPTVAPPAVVKPPASP